MCKNNHNGNHSNKDHSHASEGCEHEHEHTHVHSHPHDHSHGHEHSHGDEAVTHVHCGHCQNENSEEKDIEILTLLLDHWASHNKEHAIEYNTWIEKMNKLGKHDVAEEIIEAISLMDEANEHLKQAKKNI